MSLDVREGRVGVAIGVAIPAASIAITGALLIKQNHDPAPGGVKDAGVNEDAGPR